MLLETTIFLKICFIDFVLMLVEIGDLNQSIKIKVIESKNNSKINLEGVYDLCAEQIYKTCEAILTNSQNFDGGGDLNT